MPKSNAMEKYIFFFSNRLTFFCVFAVIEFQFFFCIHIRLDRLSELMCRRLGNKGNNNSRKQTPHFAF